MSRIINAFTLLTFLLVPQLSLAADSIFQGPAGRDRLIEFIQQNPNVIDQADKIKTTLLPLVSMLPGSDGYQPGAFSKRNFVAARRAPVYLETKPSITSGREFVPGADWNLWLTDNYYDLRDQRYEINLDGYSNVFVLGIDKKIGKRMVIGAMTYYQNFKSWNLGGNWSATTYGAAIGPYFAYQLSKKWAANFNFTYSQSNNANYIGNISGNFISNSYAVKLLGRGDYSIGKFNISPKPSVFYCLIYNQAYQMSGPFLGTQLNLAIPKANFAAGIIDFALEINRDFQLTYFKLLEPFIEAAVQYAFERPNNGQILTGNLFLVSISPWNGVARLGARLLIADPLFLEASAGYLSIGHPDLEIWEAKLYLSYAF